MIANVFSPAARAISETRRILRLTRKPKRSEYTESVKICGAGILITGTIGFIIFLIFQYFQWAM
ncbi:MAG: protein translocase SEC61 complex subunit gamma [Candidatus Altiarchaeota archaeon]